jgi:hypothetical protein
VRCAFDLNLKGDCPCRIWVVEFLLASKTLYNYFLEEIENVYIKARKQAIKKTNLSSEIFPQQCPFQAEQILNSDYLPDFSENS